MDRKKNRRNGNDRYRPKYHASVPSGWANDPNGLIWFDGKAHLFFQHNPYAPKWGRMYWGHMVSEDMVRWSEEAVALKPDKWYDRIGGCFSGTALAEKNRMYLMYTGAGLFRQRQCLVESEDGIVFHKYAKNPERNGKNIFGYEKERNIKYGGGHYASDCGDGIGGDASGEWHPFDERKEELTVLIGRSL